MTYRFAYFFPGIVPMQLRDAPVAAFLREAWGVGQWTDQAQGTGTLSVWPKSTSATGVEAFGEPRDIGMGGILYYPSKVKPAMDDLIRPEQLRGTGDWLITIKGEEIFVPLALATPRQVLIGRGGIKTGDYATEFGILGHEVWQEMQNKANPIPQDDPRITKLAQLALRHSYQVTDDMIEDQLPCVLSTIDLDLLFGLVYGLDPKALAAVPAQSPSAQAPTPTAP